MLVDMRIYVRVCARVYVFVCVCVGGGGGGGVDMLSCVHAWQRVMGQVCVCVCVYVCMYV